MQSDKFAKNCGYTTQPVYMDEYPWMTKQVNNTLVNFGERLATLRKDAGYTQAELAVEIGVTQRVVAYYEGETQHPPTTLLPILAQTLGVTTDELLGLQPVKKKKQATPDTRLKRRMQQIEKLPAKDRRQLIQVIDTFLKAAQM